MLSPPSNSKSKRCRINFGARTIRIRSRLRLHPHLKLRLPWLPRPDLPTVPQPALPLQSRHLSRLHRPSIQPRTREVLTNVSETLSDKSKVSDQSLLAVTYVFAPSPFSAGPRINRRTVFAAAFAPALMRRPIS